MHPNISKLIFTLILISISIFTGLFVFETDLYDLLSREDHVIEYLSSFFLLFSSFFFLRSFIHSKSHHSTEPKWSMFLLLGISVLFFLAAGEEVSWGQRLFDFSTPEYLSTINDQNEFNFHNINKKLFDRLLDRVTIIFVIVTSAFILLKKDAVIGIKIPDIYIICAFAITPFYRQDSVLDFHHLVYLPLIALLIYAIINKAKQSSVAIIATLIVSFLIPVIHTKYYHLFPSHNNSANEFKEFLFCLSCLAYSYVIMDKIKRDRTQPKLDTNAA